MTAVPLHNGPLRLFWWKGTPNFGDALSRIVTAHVSGRAVQHSRPAQADLFAVGSILQIVRRNFSDKSTPKNNAPWIWGSGVLHHIPNGFLENVQVALLRGPVTAALLGLQTNRFGDPGLLIADALGDKPKRGDRIGLVPHHSQIDDPMVRAVAASDPAFDLIDPRGEPEVVCQQIGACRHVFASSLHGLITADSYGVPSTWVWPGDQGYLKYHDYAASIGRAMIAPEAWEDIPGLARGLHHDDGPLPHADGIAAAQAALYDTFPAALRSQQALAADPTKKTNSGAATAVHSG